MNKKLNNRLEKAKKLCQQRHVELTSLRLAVLELIYENEDPVTAYELLRQLRVKRPNAQPPTIYRSLEFLTKHQLVHRIASENTYIACHNPLNTHENQFLICRDCNTTIELNNDELTNLMRAIATTNHFSCHTLSIEITGACQSCCPADEKETR